MRKQTSSNLLRLGICRGWNLKFFANLKFYSISLKQCIFIFLLFKTQLIKKKFWLVVQFIFYNLKKCFIKLFFWRFLALLRKRRRFAFFIHRKLFKNIRKSKFLIKQKKKVKRKLKKYLKFKIFFEKLFNFLKNFNLNFCFKYKVKIKEKKVKWKFSLKFIFIFLNYLKNKNLVFLKKLWYKKKHMKYFFKITKKVIKKKIIKKKSKKFNKRLTKFKKIKLFKFKIYIRNRSWKRKSSFFLIKKFKSFKLISSQDQKTNLFFFKKFNNNILKTNIKKKFLFLSLKIFLKKFILKHKLLQNFLKRYKFTSMLFIFLKSLKFSCNNSILKLFLNQRFSINNFFSFFFKQKNGTILFNLLKLFFYKRSSKNLHWKKKKLFFLRKKFIKKFKLFYLNFYNYYKNFFLLNFNKKKSILINKNLRKKSYNSFIQSITIKIWKLKLEKLLRKLIPGQIKINIFNIMKYFRKSTERFFFEQALYDSTMRKPKHFLKQILKKQPHIVFNLIKIFGICFKIIGTSHLLGKYIAMQLKMIKKHWSFTRILTKLLDEYWFKYKNQVRGCKIVFIGKFNGSSRTRKVSLKFGEFNIHRFTSKVDYSLSESFSLFGIFGIKIWIQAY